LKLQLNVQVAIELVVAPSYPIAHVTLAATIEQSCTLGRPTRVYQRSVSGHLQPGTLAARAYLAALVPFS
jgi:hypothetical protein